MSTVMRHPLLVMLAVLCLAAAAPVYIPTDATRGLDGEVRISFAKVDMALRASDPQRYPMFSDLLRAAPAGGRRTVTMAELQAELNKTTPESGPGLFVDSAKSDTFGRYAPPLPLGFIFHEARVGSTLAANSTSYMAAVCKHFRACVECCRCVCSAIRRERSDRVFRVSRHSTAVASNC